MRLVRLSIVSIAGCLVGLAALAALMVASLERMRAAEADVATLFELRERLDDFSAASDSILLHGADPGLWRAFEADARDLQEDLHELGRDAPGAHHAARQIEIILDALQGLGMPGRPRVAGDGGAPRPAGSPLDLPPGARVIMSQVAGHGIALDTAVDSLLRQRQRTIAREATWIGGGFAAAALLFGAVCVLAFALIHRRIAGPIRALSATIERIHAGDTGARAGVSGDDELAELSGAFNRMVEQRERAETSLREHEHELEQRERMLAESQRIARVGGWRLHIADMTLQWSDETYRIVGVDPATFTPSPEAFFEHVHPDDLGRLLAERDEVLAGNQPHDLELRIVRGDGAVRHVHERAKLERDADGTPRYLTGTIQDVTEQRALEEHLHQFRRLIEAGQDLYAIKDADCRYVLCNQAYADIYGLDRQEVEGAHVADIVGHEFFEAHVRPVMERCLAGEPQVFETERMHARLGRRQMLVRYYPIASPDGRVRQMGVAVTDVTEVKQAEEQVREQAHLLEIAGRVARLGGWSIDLAANRVAWSGVVAEIHGMPHGYGPSIDEGITFFAPEHRERLRAHFTACAEQGKPYDDEIQVVNARSGERVWVRVVGEPVRDDAGRVVRVQGAIQDISALKAAEHERQALDERLRRILERMTDAFFTLDTEWRFTYVNAGAERVFGRRKQELLGQDVWAEYPAAVGTRIEHEYRHAVAEGVATTFEEYYEPLGKWLEIRAHPSEDGLAVFFRDISERRAMIDRLRASEASLKASRDELELALDTRKALIDSLPAQIALLSHDGTLLEINEQWREFEQREQTGLPSHDVGDNYLELCEQVTGDQAEDARAEAAGLRQVLAGGRDTFTHEYPYPLDERPCWFRLMANRIGRQHDDEHPPGAVVMHIDITERKLAEQELQRLAYQDPLTGLPSRHGFTRRLADELERTGWQPGARVLMLNLRNQRDVNDSHGYAVGDHVLIQVAERLVERAGEGALVSRPGGDEFAVFLPELDSEEHDHRARAIAATFNHPIELEHVSVETGAHFGVTVLGEQERPPEELMREAAVALFHGRHGRQRSTWDEYSPEIDRARQDRVELTRDLQRALANDEFELHFQPKVRLADGSLVGAEALLRWHHPERGLQSPATFIPIAEQSQLIAPLGDWVLREACSFLRAWQRDGLDIVRIAVNVSLVQFTVGDFAASVRDALDAHDVQPSSLTLEITESVFEQESEELYRQLQALHELGVQLSLDDFGTGYSSLLYLQRYPFDEIKIDQAFVRNMLDEEYSRRIVNTVLGLAGALGAEPIAEGIENQAVRDALLALGCRVGQGFHYSMPLEAEDFRWLLDQRTSLPLASGEHR